MRPVTDRTYDRWAEPSGDSWGEPGRDASRDARDEPREAHWGETRDRWTAQSRWDGPNDPRWDDPGPAPRADESRGTRWDIPAVPPAPPPPSSREVVPVRRGSGSSGRGRKQRRKLKLWQEIPLLVLIAFALAFLVRTFLFQAFYIPSGSMEETLVLGDRVLVNRVVYSLGDPSGATSWCSRARPTGRREIQADPNASFFSKVGGGLSDLVGLGKPGEKDFIKRVIGLPATASRAATSRAASSSTASPSTSPTSPRTPTRTARRPPASAVRASSTRSSSNRACCS